MDYVALTQEIIVKEGQSVCMYINGNAVPISLQLLFYHEDKLSKQ